MFTGSLEIGAYVLKTFFNNDIALAVSRNSNKAVSFNTLCSRPDLAVSRSSLSRMVHTAAQEKFLKSRRIQTEKLSYAQRMELVTLPNDDRKIEIVRRCINEALSVRRLRALVQAIRQQQADALPQPVLPAAAAKKHERELEHLMDGSNVPVFFHDRTQLKALPRDVRKRLAKTVAALLQQVPMMVGIYENPLRNLQEITLELEES